MIRLRANYVIMGLLVLAASMRVWRIDAALWYDEAFTAWLVTLPFSDMINASLGDVHPPGYYMLLWPLAHALGPDEVVLRLPSLLAGIGLIIVVYSLAQAMNLSKPATWLATGITALSPFQVYYSQEARSYAIFSLVVCLAALAVVKQQYKWAIVTSVLAGLLHNLAIVYVASLWVAALIYHQQPRRLIKPLTGLAAGYGLIVPWLLYQTNQVTGNYWIPPLTSAGRLVATLDDLIWFTPNSTFVFASGLVTSLILVVMLYDLRFEIFGLRFLVVMTLLPLLLVTLASVIWQPVLISRVMAPAAPFLYLWTAETVTRSTHRVKLFAIVGIPTLLLISLAPLWGPAGRAPLDEQMIDLYDMYQPGDRLYHANVGSYVVWHYYRPDIPQYLWPQDTNLDATLSSSTRTAMDMNEIDFSNIVCAAPRWWLIQFDNPTTTPSEMGYINNLIDKYNGRKIAVLREDVTTAGYLILLAPDCGITDG